MQTKSFSGTRILFTLAKTSFASHNHNLSHDNVTSRTAYRNCLTKHTHTRHITFSCWVLFFTKNMQTSFWPFKRREAPRSDSRAPFQGKPQWGNSFTLIQPLCTVSLSFQASFFCLPLSGECVSTECAFSDCRVCCVLLTLECHAGDSSPAMCALTNHV